LSGTTFFILTLFLGKSVSTYVVSNNVAGLVTTYDVPPATTVWNYRSFLTESTVRAHYKDPSGECSLWKWSSAYWEKHKDIVWQKSYFLNVTVGVYLLHTLISMTLLLFQAEQVVSEMLNHQWMWSGRSLVLWITSE